MIASTTAIGPALYPASSAGSAAAPSNKSAETPTRPSRGTDQVQLSSSQQKQVDDLKKRDADVHRHEEAHLAAAGGYAQSGAVYDYQTGPDGNQYAVGGHVDIDTGAVPNDPQATIQKEQTVKRAALAPADPSSEDQAVAAKASQTEASAQLQLAEKSKGNGTKAATGTLIDVKA